MKRDNVNYLLVGSFVLLMGAVLFYALYRITGHSAKGEAYVTHFPNVAGIKPGSVVTFEGFEVGNVADVEPVARDGRPQFRLTLNLRRPLPIPVDSHALIATPGMLAAPLVDIRSGEAREVLAEGGEIPGRARVDLMETLAALAVDFGRITEGSVKPLLASINRDVPPAMADLRSTIERVNRTAARVETLFGDQNLAHWQRILRNADGVSGNALKLSADLARVRDEVEHLLRDARGFVGETRVLVGDSRALVNGSGKDVKDVLRRVDAVLYQLESAGRHLNEFSRTIRENPASLLQSKPPLDPAGVEP